MKNFYFTLLLLFFAPLLFAQAQNTQDDEQELVHRAILKFSPLSLLDNYSAVQFAVEQRIGPTSAFQLEGGYIFPYMRNDEMYTYFNGMEGYRFRAEFKYYFKLSADNSGGVYFAPEVFHLNVDFDRTSAERVNVSGLPGYDYYQRVDYEVHKKVWGYHAKMGYQRMIFKGIVLDFYGGIGARHVFIDSNKPGIEGNRKVTNDVRTFYSIYDKGTFFRPSASLGFKIGFILR